MVISHLSILVLTFHMKAIRSKSFCMAPWNLNFIAVELDQDHIRSLCLHGNRILIKFSSCVPQLRELPKVGRRWKGERYKENPEKSLTAKLSTSELAYCSQSPSIADSNNRLLEICILACHMIQLLACHVSSICTPVTYIGKSRTEMQRGGRDEVLFEETEEHDFKRNCENWVVIVSGLHLIRIVSDCFK
ncbi:hypothetical protein CEXT_358341 [Caerostris extrusa]|uniref:Uncharacterized protein n=1 Tax=Caerostris extrusa TaxID=172846 RepID=A0AAV4U829_CAEEX|nr:hypothetical protein CEXT_358341 [Caerostris extrusa]